MENTYLRDAIEKIEELVHGADAQTLDANGQNYIVTTGKQVLNRITPVRYAPEVVTLRSLNGLMEIIRKEIRKASELLFVNVESPTTVRVFSSYLTDEESRRIDYYLAKADLPSVETERFCDNERFMIMLRSKFAETEDANYLLKLLSKIKNEEGAVTEDNGITQTVKVKKGVALVGEEPVKSKVTLRPYRTFLEVEQPESEFLVRLNENGDIGLFEADGGMWKKDAIRNVKWYLEEDLEELIEAGKVAIIA